VLALLTLAFLSFDNYAFVLEHLRETITYRGTVLTSYKCHLPQGLFVHHQ